jgi:hypothetical protein
MMRPMASVVERLSAASRRPENAWDLVWPDALDADVWAFGPELISLYGTPAYDAMDGAGHRRLALAEAVNFFSINIHGEKALIEGLARRIHGAGTETISPYLHHFLGEENTHMFAFAEFCRRYAGKIYPQRQFALPRAYAPGEEDFLFFAKVLIFEDVADAYNRRMAEDARLVPVARAINRLHHLDEARHLAFGRRLVKELFERHAPVWTDETKRGIRRYLGDYLAGLRAEYCNPDAYRDAGLADSLSLRATALADPGREKLWRDLTARCRNYLHANGMLEDERLPNAQDARSALRKWLLARDPKLRPETLTARTLLLEARIVTSLQLMDLVLFVEELRGRAIAPESLRPEAFASIDAICATWLEDNAP